MYSREHYLDDVAEFKVLLQIFWGEYMCADDAFSIHYVIADIIDCTFWLNTTPHEFTE